MRERALENGLQEQDHHHQSDEEDDADGAAEEFEHGTLRGTFSPGECSVPNIKAVG
jgi:hypothetical protein